MAIASLDLEEVWLAGLLGQEETLDKKKKKDEPFVTMTRNKQVQAVTGQTLSINYIVTTH